jgi:hypothetical protein
MPNIVVQRVATDPPAESPNESENSVSKSNNSRIASTMSTLETVQESSTPVTPEVDSIERYGFALLATNKDTEENNTHHL